ncbi:hypothetical protein [Paenarthrobacter aromaticivorans]|uniref:hypothetical protein n=1 Tax=Paenarthrobacter aromaticivorans TaxID=2849150 RepID=UPI003A81282A
MSQKSRPPYPPAHPYDVVIVGGARTPQGKLNGQLAELSNSAQLPSAEPLKRQA